jgi:starvation-inducible outer membrane lipoprotein
MKKVLFIVAVAISLTACNSAPSTAPSTADSTTIVETPVDSMHVSDSSIIDTLKK